MSQDQSTIAGTKHYSEKHPAIYGRPTEKEKLLEEIDDLRAALRDAKNKLEVGAFEETLHAEEQREKAALARIKRSFAYRFLESFGRAIEAFTQALAGVQAWAVNRQIKMLEGKN